MTKIKVETIVKGNIEKIWEYWNEPKHIMKWAFASDDWEAPYAKNNLTKGGKFLTRMSSKDKTQSFDFTGTYMDVVPYEKIDYVISDGREVSVRFEKLGHDEVKITEEFDPEKENSEEKQKEGWQAILENFKKYVESEA